MTALAPAVAARAGPRRCGVLTPASQPARIAFGVAVDGPGDVFARQELAEHTRALCLAVHGTRPGHDCRECADLLRTAA